nr:Ral GTPase-activating protein subunit alpha-2 [Polyrhizophydium stewartii]
MLSDAARAVQSHVQDEVQATTAFRLSVIENGASSRRAYMHARSEEPKDAKSMFQTPRLLLSQLGFLTFDFLKSGDFHMLSKTPSLIRDIKGLDRKPSREVAKVAVIYVAPGQEDEQSIFRNSCGSYEYDEFVASLGWEVCVAKSDICSKRLRLTQA